MRCRTMRAALLAILALSGSPKAWAQGPDLEALQRQMELMKQQFEELQRQLAQQERFIKQLQEEQKSTSAKVSKPRAIDQTVTEQVKTLDVPPAPEPLGGGRHRLDLLPTAQPAPGPGYGLGRVYQSLNPEISLDGLFAFAGSSARDLQTIETGGHDPVQRGFTVQNLELVLGATVDPYFRADANLVFQIDRRGETVVEVEEAYLTTLALPYSLQARGGTFFTQFGRLNPFHPHTWDFADQPLVNGRLLGPDGLRSPGVSLSYLVPLPFYLELIGTVQNSNGETAFSFRNTPGKELFGRTILDREVKTPADMLYVPRIKTSLDLSDTQTLVLGASGAFGPNGTGTDTRTAIYGVDLYYKWKPLTNERGWPFVAWQTEAMYRDLTAGADDSRALPRERLNDYGLYSQITWGFSPGWVGGLRADYVSGSGGGALRHSDLLLNRRFRLSPNLTYYPTEFSKIRLQYNYDDIEGRGEGIHTGIVQFEFLIGTHGAHVF